MRPVKLEFFDHSFKCPICKTDIVYTSMQAVILSSRRKCPSCKGELLIHEGTVKGVSERKLPQPASLPRVKRSRK